MKSRVKNFASLEVHHALIGLGLIETTASRIPRSGLEVVEMLDKCRFDLCEA